MARMEEVDALKAAFRGDEPAETGLSRRQRRAARTRARALSPVRILVQVLLVPVVTLGLTTSIYLRTSPYERVDAMRHLAALTGCKTAHSVGLAPAAEGGIGYHKRNDPDGDGVACDTGPVRAAEPVIPVTVATDTGGMDADMPVHDMAGAKFLRP